MEPLVIVSALLVGYYAYCSLRDTLDDLRREGISWPLQFHFLKMVRLIAPLCTLLGIAEQFRKEVYYSELGLIAPKNRRRNRLVKLQESSKIGESSSSGTPRAKGASAQA